MFDEEPILTNRDQTLEQMSVEELEARIGELKEAIKACETEIDKKQNQKSAANALFDGGS